SLAQDVDPEAAQPREPPGAVVISNLVDFVPVPLREELHDELLRLRRGELLLREGHQLTADPGPNHVARLDMDVGGALLDRRLQDHLDHRSDSMEMKYSTPDPPSRPGPSPSHGRSPSLSARLRVAPGSERRHPRQPAFLR